MNLMQDCAVLNNIEIVNYTGFDSFEGLPKLADNESLRWSEGAFKHNKSKAYNQIKRHSSKNTTIEIIKGRYDSIDISIEPNDMTWIIHIDCDLYSSTIDALKIVKKVIKAGGGLILCDDYFSGLLENIKGEKAAIHDFCLEEKVKLIHWNNYSHNGAMFICPRVKSINN